MNDKPGVRWTEASWTVDTKAEQLQSGAANHPQVSRAFLPQREARELVAGDPAFAERRAREALNVDPGDPQALLLLGAALRRQGKIEEARAVLQSLVDAQPHLGEAWHELALALAQLGRRESAIEASRRAIDFNWRDTEAWFALGSLLSFPKSAEVDESTVLPQLEDAKKALRSGRADIAEKTVRDLIATEPDNVRAMKFLADMLFTLARWPELVALLKRCLEIAPDYVAARFRLATVLFVHGKFYPALPHIDELLKTDSTEILYRAMKALALGWSREFEPAIAEFGSFIGDCNDQPGLWLEYARLLRNAKNGNTLAAYRRVIEILPSFVEAYTSIAASKSIPIDESIIASVRDQLAREELGPESRAQLHFVLGRAFEDLGRYAESFENYKASNEILYTVRNFAMQANNQYLRRAKAIFTPEFFGARRNVGCQEPGAVFIVGMPRAGSTLVEQIIGSHSEVEALGELKHLPRILGKLVPDSPDDPTLVYPYTLPDLEPADFRRIGEEYMAAARAVRTAGTPFFTDKMPYNYTQIGLIHLALPNAKIVDARRHPLDCCFSCFKHYFPAGQAVTHTLQNVGRAYANYVELMAHFDEVLPGKAHRVIYENLIEDFEAEVRRLLDFLGLPFEEGCLKFHENERLVRTISSEQVRMPLYKSGMAHWQHYEPWLGPLKEELGYILDVYPAAPKFYPKVNVNFAKPLHLGQAGRRFTVVKGLRQLPFETAVDSPAA